MKDNKKEIRNMDDLGRIVIPRKLRQEVLGEISIWEMEGKPFSIEKIYSSKDKKWGFMIIPVEEEYK